MSARFRVVLFKEASCCSNFHQRTRFSAHEHQHPIHMEKSGKQNIIDRSYPRTPVGCHDPHQYHHYQWMDWRPGAGCIKAVRPRLRSGVHFTPVAPVWGIRKSDAGQAWNQHLMGRWRRTVVRPFWGIHDQLVQPTPTLDVRPTYVKTNCALIA